MSKKEIDELLASTRSEADKRAEEAGRPFFVVGHTYSLQVIDADDWTKSCGTIWYAAYPPQAEARHKQYGRS